ncbi:MAG TPA: hypothetical protein VLF41_01740 [Candidatus Nanoarchaeia archaeon]|nr:hypothetical protein [Candidatus Nanoarchaeia archaeon]
MDSHPKVRHPKEVLKEKRAQESPLLRLNDSVLEWITSHILASVIFFDLALIVPLLAIPAPEGFKITLGVISGSWIQLWALPALQRSQNKTQAQNDAKAEVDHQTLTYISNLQDEQLEILHELQKLNKDKP